MTIGAYQESQAQLYHQGLYEYSTTKKHKLGTIRRLDDGRQFVYVQLGAANSVAGNWYQSAVGAGMAEDTVTVAHPVGTRDVVVTESGNASGLDANYFEDGFLVVDAGGGIGEIYKVRGNAAFANAGNAVVKLYEPLATLWSVTTTNVHLFINPYKAVVIGATAGTSCPVGVAPRIYPANSYCWLQTHGLAGLQCDLSAAGGDELDEKLIEISTTTAGYGLVTGSPNTDLGHYKYKLGYLVAGGDGVDNEATLVYLAIGA